MSTTPTQDKTWLDYITERPTVAGVYEWRLPSRRVPGAFVTFYGHMRERGAGYATALSPAFDYWDGWRLHVPAGTQWRAAPTEVKCQWHEYTNLAVEGLKFEACPYCGRFGVLEGHERSGSGVMVGPGPHEMNSWQLRCCAWGSSPSVDDPRKIEATRQAAFAVIRKL